MCGTVVHTPQTMKVKGRKGDSGFNISGVGEGKWIDHARSETLYKWNGGWKIGYLQGATSFTERSTATGERTKEVPFDIPNGKRIKIIYLDKPGIKPFNIVTQAADSEQAKIHGRWPVIE